MTAETRPPASATVQFDGDDLVLELRHDAEGPYYTFPGTRSEAPAPRVTLPLERALHARIRPAGTAEAVLRAWSQGAPPQGAVEPVDPSAVEPVRVRAGAVVIRDGSVLLIRFTEDDGASHYEIPGGGVEEGETPETAVLRELDEETGLAGTVGPRIARVWKGGRHEHYFRAAATGEIGPPETLDNYGGTPLWVPVEELPALPLWPKRLSWRIAHWHRTGWPDRPAELADSIEELEPPCTW
ncbi:NUDIX domain-containing protein [Streptomyces californicus]